jgi:uncharacterized protein
MLVVSDTSVLLNLAAAGEAELLRQLFGRVAAPPTVQREFLRLAAGDLRFRTAAWPSWVEVITPAAIPASLLALPRPLDPGETEALSLALELHADLVLMDEAAGRAVAKAHGLAFTGTAGILLRAKASGLLTAVAPALEGSSPVRDSGSALRFTAKSSALPEKALLPDDSRSPLPPLLLLPRHLDGGRTRLAAPAVRL